MNGQTSETKNGEIDDNSNQLKYNTSAKVTWDGKDVPDGPWLDQELFMIGGMMKVTNREVVVGGSFLIVVLLALSAVCIIVSFYKRKTIAY